MHTILYIVCMIIMWPLIIGKIEGVSARENWSEDKIANFGLLLFAWFIFQVLLILATAVNPIGSSPVTMMVFFAGIIIILPIFIIKKLIVFLYKFARGDTP